MVRKLYVASTTASTHVRRYLAIYDAQHTWSGRRNTLFWFQQPESWSLQVPGNIRRAEHFVAFLRRFVLYLKEKLGVNEVTTENPTTFLAQLQERLAIEGEQHQLS